MAPYSNIVPKPALPVLGVPTLRYLTAMLSRSDLISNFVVNVHHLPEIARRLYPSMSDIVPVQLSDESDLLLDTAGGVAHAMQKFSDATFCVSNTDAIFDFDLSRMLHAHEENRKKGGLATLLLDSGSLNNGAYSEFSIDPKTLKLTKLGEKASGRPFYLGFAIYERQLFESLDPDQPSCLIRDVLQNAIASGKVYGHLDAEFWLDTGTISDWYETHFQLMQILETEEARNWLLPFYETHNVRVGRLQWCVKGQAKNCSRKNLSTPFYWGDSDHFEESLLDHAVVIYDAISAAKPAQSGISFQGVWTSVPSAWSESTQK